MVDVKVHKDAEDLEIKKYPNSWIIYLLNKKKEVIGEAICIIKSKEVSGNSSQP